MTYHMQLTGYVGGPTFNAREVRRVLAQYPGKHVDILIDSFGGSLAEGLSICGALRDHGDVTVHLRGMNASAATLASMGAGKVIIAPESMYLVHKVSMGFFDWADRNADQLTEFIGLLQSAKDDLDTMDRSIAELYASRCRRPAKDLLQLMKEEKWITAADAKAWGFADEITAHTDDQAPKGSKSASGLPTEGGAGGASITKAQADAFRALGLPLPPVAIESETKSMIAEFTKSIIEPIKALLKHDKDMDQNQQPTNQAQPAPAAAQGVTPCAQPAPAVAQGVTPCAQPGEAASSRQTAQQTAQADLQAENDRLKKELADLKAKTPGARTTNVVSQPTPNSRQQAADENDPFARFVAVGKKARALFDSIP